MLTDNGNQVELPEILAYSVASAARALGVSKSLIHGLIREGDLPAIKVGRRTLILATEIEKRLA
ncbi:helix-turn-helix domain-containing protein [Oceanibaculum pacificum]|uniref:Helix-turn-helix domain-containing protein n=1 Tax=Oceanibaculum pacificum TaxID=580166 RepID=A0A154WES2_9PROT|nr:helix-turn-helix domain-containing protein [Oceanibaculum pacificum]KZD11965.1 hypothetical protein AUP43_05680 [Oceanibaculum pacificum]